MVGILQLAKDRLAQNANANGVYIDFTMGRGRDTLFLCSIAPQGKVYAFDIQPSALEQTAELLAQHGMTNAELILDPKDRNRTRPGGGSALQASTEQLARAGRWGNRPAGQGSRPFSRREDTWLGDET